MKTFLEYLFWPVNCCGGYSIFALFVYLAVGAAAVGLLLGTILRALLTKPADKSPSDEIRKYAAIASKINTGTFSVNFVTVIYALVSAPILFFDFDNHVKLYTLIGASIIFVIVDWFFVRDASARVVISMDNRRAIIYACSYYVFLLFIMSSVLFSGPGGSVGVLRGRWYGFAYIFFPAMTSVFARAMITRFRAARL